jgi:hypothetical protein
MGTKTMPAKKTDESTIVIHTRGVTTEQGQLKEELGLTPFKSESVGRGYRNYYRVTKEQLRNLIDHLADVACNLADDENNEGAVNAIYSDLGGSERKVGLMDQLDQWTT